MYDGNEMIMTIMIIGVWNRNIHGSCNNLINEECV